MREIKFRAWDSKTEKYFPPDVDEYWTFSIIGETTMGHLLHHYRIEDYNNLIIEQFTGLTDKNGKEVYEGDLISFQKYNQNTDKFVCHIEYSSHLARFILKARSAFGWTITKVRTKGTVIGNIHQDRHLLKDLT